LNQFGGDWISKLLRSAPYSQRRTSIYIDRQKRIQSTLRKSNLYALSQLSSSFYARDHSVQRTDGYCWINLASDPDQEYVHFLGSETSFFLWVTGIHVWAKGYTNEKDTKPKCLHENDRQINRGTDFQT